MAVPQVAILSNLLSTRNKSNIRKIRSLLELETNVFHFESEKVEDILVGLKQFNKTKPSILIISGGDGTIQATLTSIINDKPFDVIPPIAVLPSGKTNMIAVDLGSGGRPEKILKKLIKVAQGGSLEDFIERKNIIELDLGDGKPPRVGMFFGGAAMVSVINYSRDIIHPMGLPNFISHIIALFAITFSVISGAKKETSALFSHPSYIHLKGGGVLRGRFIFIFVTTLNKLILGAKPYGFDGKGGLRFSSIDHSPKALFLAIKGLITNKFGSTTINGVNVRRVDEIRITGKDEITLDGEVYKPDPGRPFVLRGQKSLNFISLENKKSD
ncbi:MAG: diacylglycerol kinase family protein [Sphingomonadales bacterium]